ncbi:hypothetical protein CABS01_06856 [Colletotrichum abscissum]|uniref:uncharacterized protein n=1 Tax=Colletotrichum abscissum TaxID=1671311 RepID=UPI0027D6C3D2|nr:uncharacterized protein CABS01_06856 [Colletotrichum abscissum]KAK1514877.1 hypothetical protein CABS01_06856 [Colletotrichum abscissum]
MSLPVVIRVFRRLGYLFPDRDVRIGSAWHFWPSGRQAFSSVTSEVSEQGWPQKLAMANRGRRSAESWNMAWRKKITGLRSRDWDVTMKPGTDTYLGNRVNLAQVHHLWAAVRNLTTIKASQVAAQNLQVTVSNLTPTIRTEYGDRVTKMRAYLTASPWPVPLDPSLGPFFPSLSLVSGRMPCRFSPCLSLLSTEYEVCTLLRIALSGLESRRCP